MTRRGKRKRVLVLWNMVGEDVYERLRAEGPTPLPWSTDTESTVVQTVREEIDAVVAAVRACGHAVRSVNVEDDLDRLLGEIRTFQPDVIFNLVDFFNDTAVQESWVAGLYGLLGVAFTGASPLCLATCQRKYRTKRLLDAEGLPTPAYRRFQSLPIPARHGLGYPLIVKPAREDASGGIDAEAVVRNRRELEARVKLMLEEYRQPVLVERYIEGREIHVSILGNDPPEVLPFLEVVFYRPTTKKWRPRILSYDAKWDPLSRDFYTVDTRVPAPRVSRTLRRRIEEIALAAYRALECRDYARIDMRIDEKGQPYILEVNPNPELTDGAGFTLCAEKSGRTFNSTIGELVDMALARQR